MKCLIMSDTHGDEHIVREVASAHQDIDILIHCGDSELSRRSPVLENIYIVQGNCDQQGEFPEEVVASMEGIRTYVTHGHWYNVKMTHVPLSYRGEELGVQLVCFGHSHIPIAFEENGIVYINPGSLRLPRRRPEKTYAVADFSSAEYVHVQFFDGESGEEVEELSRRLAVSPNN